MSMPEGTLNFRDANLCYCFEPGVVCERTLISGIGECSQQLRHDRSVVTSGELSSSSSSFALGVGLRDATVLVAPVARHLRLQLEFIFKGTSPLAGLVTDSGVPGFH